ncbi:MAG TPA: hypothetical protein VJA94_06230 [Candidatus Angelobacter sp.]
MPEKKARKQPAQTILSTVRTAMAQPRMAESSKENADTLANGGHMAVRVANRADLQTSMPAAWHASAPDSHRRRNYRSVTRPKSLAGSLAHLMK